MVGFLWKKYIIRGVPLKVIANLELPVSSPWGKQLFSLQLSTDKNSGIEHLNYEPK